MLPKRLFTLLLNADNSYEYSDACSTLLFNPENYEWTRDVGDTFNIGDIYPPLVKSHSYVGNVTSSLAKELGLSSDVAVAIYAGVVIMHGAIGAGVIHDKSALCSIGTSGVVLNVEYQRVTSYDK